MRLIKEDGSLNGLLVILAARYGLKSGSTFMPPVEMNQFLQENWRQNQLLHAYQITGEPAKDESLEILKKLGCVDEILTPSLSEYEEWGPMDFSNFKMQRANLLMGATRTAVVKRLNFFVYCNQGRCVPNLFYLMGGARKLDQLKENEQVLCTPAGLPFKKGWIQPKQIPTTEASMMQMVWNQSDLPNGWHATLVDTPMIHVPGMELGTSRPPNTTETVSHWLLQEQKPGYYIVGSSQPYIEYQRLATERMHEELLEQGKINFPCYFKGCGSTASPSLPLATFLDTLAKQFYEEMLCQKWWTGVFRDHSGAGNMDVGIIMAQGRTEWGARKSMHENLRPNADQFHLSRRKLAGPFDTKAQAEKARP